MHKVDINITKKTYEFIDGATGEKIAAKKFTEKYPGLPVGGLSVDNGFEGVDEGGKEEKDK